MAARPLARVAALGLLGAASLALGYASLLPILPMDGPGGPGGLALSVQAEERFETAKAKADFDAAAELARRSLRKEPLGVPALRVLALDAEARAAEDRAGRIMDVVARRSLRDTLSQTWLLDHALRRADYVKAAEHADAILRRRTDFAPVVIPALVRAATDPAAIRPTVERLAQNPPWRSGYLRVLGYEGDPKAARALLEQLNLSRSPVSDNEAGNLVIRLRDQGEIEDAHAAWLSLLGGQARVGLAAPYDGDFRGRRGSPPFNWQFSNSAGRAVQIVRMPDGEGALYVRTLEPALMIAEQFIMAPPGRYRFSGAMKVVRPDADRYTWRIQCFPRGGEPLAEMRPAGQIDQWASFTTYFTVPSDHDCRALMLTLNAVAAPSREPAESWHRDLKIEPLV